MPIIQNLIADQFDSHIGKYQGRPIKHSNRCKRRATTRVCLFGADA